MITPEQLITEIKKNKRELFDGQGNRLYRIKDLRKLLTAHTEPEDENIWQKWERYPKTSGLSTHKRGGI